MGEVSEEVLYEEESTAALVNSSYADMAMVLVAKQKQRPGNP